MYPQLVQHGLPLREALMVRGHVAGTTTRKI